MVLTKSLPKKFKPEVIPQLETLSSLGLLKVVLIAVALPEPARQTVPPTIAPLEWFGQFSK